MTTDLDALIAEAREWARKAAFVGRNVIRDLDRGIANTRRLADALESTLAELRQERERADEVTREYELILTRQGVRVVMAERGAAVAALSRAEETIEKVRALLPGPRTFAESMSRDFAGNVWPQVVDAGLIAIALHEYDKQKERTA